MVLCYRSSSKLVHMVYIPANNWGGEGERGGGGKERVKEEVVGEIGGGGR